MGLQRLFQVGSGHVDWIPLFTNVERDSCVQRLLPVFSVIFSCSFQMYFTFFSIMCVWDGARLKKRRRIWYISFYFIYVLRNHRYARWHLFLHFWRSPEKCTMPVQGTAYPSWLFNFNCYHFIADWLLVMGDTQKQAVTNHLERYAYPFMYNDCFLPVSNTNWGQSAEVSIYSINITFEILHHMTRQTVDHYLLEILLKL